MSERNVQRKGILAAGNFIVDTVKLIDKWPKQDTLCSVLAQSRSNGGGPYNILKNLARLNPELELEACGRVGDDAEAQWVLDDCSRWGIDTRQLVRDQQFFTSTTDAMSDSTSGRRTFFHCRGANASFCEADVDFSQSHAKIFSLGYLMLLDKLDFLDEQGETGAARLLRKARAEGFITAVDSVSTPSEHFSEVALAALKEADVFFVNELEAGWVLGYEVSLNNLGQAVRGLASLGSPGTVVLHMPEGAAAYRRADDTMELQAAVCMPMERIIGTTGAGDAFAAGYLYGVHEGWEISACLKSAVCVAAMSLTDSSPSGGVAGMMQCLELGERYGYRNLDRTVDCTGEIIGL